eukprot:TRINITY_DN1507_c4_g1_i1.p1 TRINITY_DN1507_c4_g1~~TRINITY_DN1507_c4_g1_i1.p1  ORF type:complete len:868 (+),score=86.72 TRINITY_DN1507_c4_g1_i1:62-2665(+)
MSERERRESICSTLGGIGGGVTFAAGISMAEPTRSQQRRKSSVGLQLPPAEPSRERRTSILKRRESHGSMLSRRSTITGFARKTSYNDAQHNIHNEILDVVVGIARAQAEMKAENTEKLKKMQKQIKVVSSAVLALQKISTQFDTVRRESKDEYISDPVNAIAPLNSTNPVNAVYPSYQRSSLSSSAAQTPRNKTVTASRSHFDSPQQLSLPASTASNMQWGGLDDDVVSSTSSSSQGHATPDLEVPNPFKHMDSAPKGYALANSLSEGNTGSISDESDESETASFSQRVRHAERHLAINAHYRTGSGVILPEHMIRKTADIIYLILALLESYECLFSLLWPDAIPTAYKILLKVIFTLGHVFFIWIVSRTAVLDGYTLEDSSLQTIRGIYKRTWLPFDVVTSIPYDLLPVSFSMWLATPRLAHAVRVPKLLTTANPLKQASGWMSGLKASFWFFWGLNIMGILYVLIDAVSDSDKLYLDDDSNTVFDRYLQGLYWATITVSSVGYGDIVPQSRWSRLYSIPVVLISVLILSVFTGQVASSVIRLDAFQQVVKEKKAKLYSLMERYEVPWEVQKEAFSIYPTLLETSLKDYFDILRDLPPFMQDKVILCIKKKIVSQVPLFKGVEEKTLTALAAVTQQVLVAPNEYIIEAGGIGHEMYFIAQGVVEVIVEDEHGDEMCAATLQSGSWFGEIALLKHTQRTASVRSVTACSCFKLLKEDFMGILKIFPEFEVQMKSSVERRLREIADQRPATPVQCPLPHEGSEIPFTTGTESPYNKMENPLSSRHASPQRSARSIPVPSPTLSADSPLPPLPPTAADHPHKEVVHEVVHGSPTVGYSKIASVGSFKLDRVLSKEDLNKLRGRGDYSP